MKNTKSLFSGPPGALRVFLGPPKRELGGFQHTNPIIWCVLMSFFLIGINSDVKHTNIPSKLTKLQNLTWKLPEMTYLHNFFKGAPLPPKNIFGAKFGFFLLVHCQNLPKKLFWGWNSKKNKIWFFWFFLILQNFLGGPEWPQKQKKSKFRLS